VNDTIARGSQTAVITGAGSKRGIGRETARVLARHGFAIAILDVDEASAKANAAEIAQEFGVPALGVKCDVTDEAGIDAAVTAVEKQLPPIAALVNNAGITSPTRFVNIEPAEWQKLFAINAFGVYLVTRRIVPGMIERKYGRIVSLSSVSAQRGGGVFGGSHYSATKGAVLGFARALARELAPLGITSNCVAPALIDTDITGGQLVGAAREAAIAAIPVGRAGTANEVAETIAFLCTPQSSYITGATIDINGGSHIH